MQSKLGPKSRRVLFMGYPEGVKGYRLCDTTSGAFFVARNVIFDEDFRGTEDEEGEDEDEPALPLPPLSTPSSPANVVTVPGMPTTSVLAPPMATPPPNPLRKSNRTRNMTKAGKAYAEEHAATKARLDELRDRRVLVVTQGVQLDDSGHPALSEGVTSNETMDTDSLGAIKSNNDVPNIAADIAISKQAHITIRSDKRRDPSTPDYNMSIPPATYEEAMLRPDHELWFTAMKTELQTMKDMNVYEIAELPEGRKAIGCRWILEFKDDNKGGSVYKARLVAQGFSQVPGIDYGTTFTSVIKPATVRLLAALSCQHD